MKNPRKFRTKTEGGFSLIELMIATVLFTLIAGITFALLGVSLTRFQVEKDYLNSFQQASVAMDEITRDVHTAGYPPLNAYTTAALAANTTNVATPFAWMPNYQPPIPCTVLATCTVPGPYDLITEADLGDGNGVQWVRYSLQGTTLMRGVVKKNGGGADPVAATTAALVPYLDNVMNQANAAQMALIKAAYPSMFPGNVAVPVFAYSYDNGAAAQPANIREVNITLIVQSPKVDPNTQRVRAVLLTGQAVRINPNK
jgi:prepilin-type N-terminal cleavage/methylation domain-containing protein